MPWILWGLFDLLNKPQRGNKQWQFQLSAQVYWPLGVLADNFSQY